VNLATSGSFAFRWEIDKVRLLSMDNGKMEQLTGEKAVVVEPVEYALYNLLEPDPGGDFPSNSNR
jgi:hypothetical protein